MGCDIIPFAKVRLLNQYIIFNTEAFVMLKLARLILLSVLVSATMLFAQYQKAPQPIHDLLNAPPTPLVLDSPKSDQLLVVDRLQYPPIGDLAQPMLRLAGLRIDPQPRGISPRKAGTRFKEDLLNALSPNSTVPPSRLTGG